MTFPVEHSSVSARSAYHQLLDEFADPPLTYRPIPFWSWNERMEPEEVQRQVKLMAECGWGGAFIHSRTGLVTPYLGDEWFAAVDAAVQASREQGLKVWLYDEDGWPSGYSGGTVPRACEGFRLQLLIARRFDQAPPDHVTPIGTPVNGVQVMVWHAQLDDPRFNGACYASLLNRDAVEQFIQDAYEAYRQRYGDYFGDLIPAIFTDEPSITYRLRVPEGAVPFSDGLTDHFERTHGYDPLPHLHLLFTDGMGAECFRLHYYRTVSDLFERNYVRSLGRWCDKQGVHLTGHMMAEHHLYDQHSWSVNVMPMYRHFGIPGVDHLSRQVEERLSAKQCQSVANQFGKTRMLSELYGMSGQGLTFADRHWIAIQQIALGVNMLNPHLSLYTMAGCRKRDYPPNLYYQQPWWPLNHVIDVPLSRLCAAMSKGRPLAEVLVIHPQESVSALWEADCKPTRSNELVQRSVVPTSPGVADRINAIDGHFKAVLDVLLNAQRTFDLADESILATDCQIETADTDPRIRVGKMAYRSVVLPSCVTLRPTTLSLLSRFQQAGGLVVRCGQPPTMVDGAQSSGLQRWIASIPSSTLDGLPAALNKAGPPYVRFESQSGDSAALLYASVREMEDGARLIYLANLDRSLDQSGCLHALGHWHRAEYLNHWTGTSVDLSHRVSHDNTLVPIRIPSGQACLLRLSNEAAPGPDDKTPVPSRRDEWVLDPSKWDVQRLDHNAMTLDRAYWSEGSGAWSRQKVPVIAVQRRLEALGRRACVNLRFTFHTDNLSNKHLVHLVLEYPDRYVIRVNGEHVRYQGIEPWRDIRWLPIDIAHLIRDGENVIELCLDEWEPRPIGSDAPRKDFVELESVYLVGDFSVSACSLPERPQCEAWETYGLPSIGVRCYGADAFSLSNPAPLTYGDTTSQGLPFYTGRLRITVPLPELDTFPGDQYLLTLESHDAAVAEVMVGSEIKGYFVSQPCEIDVTDVIGSGERSVTITLYGTLRNLLGPHHHKDGELPAVTPNSFLPAFAEGDDVAAVVKAWGLGEHQFDDWVDRYAMVEFGRLNHLKLVRLSPGPRVP